MKNAIKKKKLVLITPTFNEAENIEKTINVLFNSFPKRENWEFHVLVVDSSSPDGTADIVRNLIPKFPQLHLLLEKQKNGLGAAYNFAMDYAFNKMQADYVMQFDADLSHDAKKITDFVDFLDKGANFVIGTRYSKGGGIPKEWAFYRKLISRMGNLFVSIVFFPSPITDWTSGYNAFSKKVYEKIKKDLSLEKGYNFMISAKVSALKNGFKIKEVPYVFKDRVAGESKLGAEYMLRALYFVVTTRIKYFVKSSFFKVALVGAFGFVVQTVFFYLFFEIFKLFSALSQALSAEIAILSNFILNNNFSFKSHKITGRKNLITKFVNFNFVSLGSVFIQFLTQLAGNYFFGDSRIIVYTFYIVGVFLGLISNFYLYKKFIWKHKKK